MKLTFVFLCLLYLFISCKNCQEIIQMETKTIERDTTIYLEGQTVYDTLHIKDSVFINSVIDRVLVDSSGKTKLKFYKDKYNRLLVSCSTKNDTIKIPVVSTEKTIIKEESNDKIEIGWWIGGFVFVTIISLALIKKFL